MLKNKIALLLISFILIPPVFALDPEPINVLPNNGVNMEAVEETAGDADSQVQEEPTAVEEKTTENATLYKRPISKKKVAKKFLVAMSGVVLSSLIIFVLLSLYNRLRDGFFINNVSIENRRETLEEPLDFNDAVKSFLDKTHWGE